MWVPKQRVIPVLTIDKRKLVKTTQFKKPNYIGDPINAIKILNDKEVDELIVLDITATKTQTIPNFEHIKQMATEAFMPLSYGGGLNTFDQVKQIFNCGIEKVIFGSAIFTNPKLIEQSVAEFGSQSIVACIDYKKNLFGQNSIKYYSGQKKAPILMDKITTYCQQLGIGELVIQSIDKDGTFTGLDIEIIQKTASSTQIPLVPLGGARNLTDFENAIQAGAHAVAAASMFVYKNNNKESILINYINFNEQ